jgi:DNA-directed RNA polymerase specialized sigma24 family protein
VGDGIERDSITQDDLTQDAFAAFWRSYTADKLACALGLGSVLSYLKSCAVTARLQESRRAGSRGTEIPSDDVPHLVVDSNPSPETVIVEASAVTGLWEIVVSHCRSEIEQLVANLTLVAGMKPSEIAVQYPDCFEDVTDIYRIKRNLLDRLRRDLELQVIYENSVDLHLFK